MLKAALEHKPTSICVDTDATHVGYLIIVIDTIIVSQTDLPFLLFCCMAAL